MSEWSSFVSPKPSDWVATAETCSALEGKGLDKIWQHIQAYRRQTTINGYFQEHRKQQAKYWMEESINEQLKSLFMSHPSIQQQFKAIEQQVIEGKISPFRAAENLIALFKGP